MLNLIPENIKTQLRSQNNFKLVKKIIILITLSIAGFSLIIIPSYWLLRNTLLNAQEKVLISTINFSGLENLRNDIVYFNQTLSAAEKIQAEHINPVVLIKELQTYIPEGITLNLLNLDLETKTITLQGIASDRASLIALENNLKNSKTFINFNYPLGSLTEPENINFSFQGSINFTLEETRIK